MTKIRIPYYVIAKGRGYWRPHPRMRRFGFSLVRCGKDGPEAWAIAEGWNQKWQAFRKGQLPAPIEVSKLSRDDAEAARRYPPGSVGAAFQAYIRTPEWSARAAVTPDMINDLASFGPNILRLNLRHAGVTDSEVKTIAGFSNLRRLRLEENAITDTAAADIGGLKSLTYLNFSKTNVTDAGLDQVSTLPKLSRVYVWEPPSPPRPWTRSKPRARTSLSTPASPPRMSPSKPRS